MNAIARAWLARHWFYLLLPIVFVAVWAVYDLRALYVAAMVIFLIYPVTMTAVWLSYSLSPRSIRAVRQKTVTIDDDKLIVNYIVEQNDPRPVLPPDTLALTDIIDVEQTSDGLLLITGPRLDDRIFLPSSVFTPDDWSGVLSVFADRLSQMDP